jgi:hypothetical protein
MKANRLPSAASRDGRGALGFVSLTVSSLKQSTWPDSIPEKTRVLAGVTAGRNFAQIRQEANGAIQKDKKCNILCKEGLLCRFLENHLAMTGTITSASFL